MRNPPHDVHQVTKWESLVISQQSQTNRPITSWAEFWLLIGVSTAPLSVELAVTGASPGPETEFGPDQAKIGGWHRCFLPRGGRTE